MSNYGTPRVARFAAMFKALANPQRLRIFLKLCACCAPRGCGETAEGMRRCVGNLGADLGLAPSTVSHHLKELRQAGLMKAARSGQRIECWITEDTLEALAAFFGGARSQAGK